MASEKSTDENKVTKNSNESENITIGSGQIQIVQNTGVIANIVARRAPSDSLHLFIQILNTLLERYKQRRGWLSRLLDTLIRPNYGNRENLRRANTKALLRLDRTAKVSNTSELTSLIRALTYTDFYETTRSEKQLRYIRMLLDYLIRNAPQDYQFIVEQFLSVELAKADTNQTANIANQIMARLVREPVVPGNVGSIEVGGSVVTFPMGQKDYDYSERLAGDETTDAPPPEKKKKSR